MPVRVILRSDAFGAQGASAPSLSFDAPRIVIGRSDGCEVRLPDTSVSGRHATLRQHGGTYLLNDEGSANGTFVGGVRLAPQSPRVLTGGELVRVGRVWLEIRFDAAPVASTQNDTKELALALVQRALASLGEDAEPRIVVRQGPDAGKRLALPQNGTPYVMGRGHGADLELDETDASRRHVQITRKGEVLYVRDLGSKNGTYLGDSRLDSGRDIPWRGAEPLRIGKDHFFYENPAAEALSELDRSADEPIAEGESIAPPQPDPDEPPTGDGTGEAAAGAAPVAQIPRGTSLAKKETPSGWGASDLVIVLIATSLLVLSVVGLYLLFK